MQKPGRTFIVRMATGCTANLCQRSLGARRLFSLDSCSLSRGQRKGVRTLHTPPLPPLAFDTRFSDIHRRLQDNIARLSWVTVPLAVACDVEAVVGSVFVQNIVVLSLCFVGYGAF